jgi:signal transduction histidine kinase
MISLSGVPMGCDGLSMLKERERLREDWISIVAHELQQPINAILLRADLMLRAGLSDEKRTQDVRQIRTAAKRLSRMVADLQDVSQLEAQRMRVNITRVDLTKLVHQVVERTQEARERTRIREPLNRRVIALADPQRLDQIASNLLSNAVKYGQPDTDISIDVEENGSEATVAVSNVGPAVPADELPLLFERYVRSRAATGSDTQGLGLGLYIAKRLVEAQGGRIWAESGPDPITTFHFTVPLDDAHRAPDATQRAAPAPMPQRASNQACP